MKLLEIDNLTKSYNGKLVLDIKNCEIKKGEITSLIGPSGAGKSTLLSIINGIEKPDTGKVLFENDEFSQSKNYSIQIARKMALVFQKPSMFNTSVFNNIAYGLRIRNFKGSNVKEKVEFIAEWTGVQDLLKQNAVTLSGGEASRVSLARAMVLNPDLLLMDEPTANLDPKNVEIIENMIRKSNDEFNTTVFLITHNMFQARRLARKTMVIMDGRIIETNDTEEIFLNSENEQTKDFLTGRMIY